MYRLQVHLNFFYLSTETVSSTIKVTPVQKYNANKARVRKVESMGIPINLVPCMAGIKALDAGSLLLVVGFIFCNLYFSSTVTSSQWS